MILSNIYIALLAYLIDKIFGEFPFLKHPIIYIGDIITFFEEKFYKDSVKRGLLLVLFVLSVVSFFVFAIYFYLQLLAPALYIVLSAFLASMFLAHRMLFDAVSEILYATNKKELLSQLVSRDTQNLNESDIYKASIETYAENLNDGVIAPLFYLLLFGLPGIILYKTINTMDSMVGYRNERYEKFGKAAALLDDFVNFIPARITALLIMAVAKQKHLFSFYKNGSLHESPNAGHPITAMALVLGIKLGGNTAYFGVMKEKAFFGKGREEINANDLQTMLQFAKKIDKTIIGFLILLAIIAFILNKGYLS
ncbi:adenosylcobinamide-phosphate synthase CbiB [Sulfurimonas paralvinellae]|uniref:Cobalamin biosynthesis protein CobD n=1 Tax=Sulfurimonas paralvinellae TaxID=317658 RepID=A0A7M1B533_9BACT|nr:adenosylcobinamide-phosphate synthase CbiB [Sulfurimonas paralvinellae]QOP44841.1 cobalamin biosynthesis protein CobD [Sulfurimonas paralvinellae]